MLFLPPGLFRLFHNRTGSPPSNVSTTLKLSGNRFVMGGILRLRLAQAVT
jgi:hypothetical protein